MFCFYFSSDKMSDVIELKLDTNSIMENLYADMSQAKLVNGGMAMATSVLNSGIATNGGSGYNTRNSCWESGSSSSATSSGSATGSHFDFSNDIMSDIMSDFGVSDVGIGNDWPDIKNITAWKNTFTDENDLCLSIINGPPKIYPIPPHNCHLFLGDLKI